LLKPEEFVPQNTNTNPKELIAKKLKDVNQIMKFKTSSIHTDLIVDNYNQETLNNNNNNEVIQRIQILNPISSFDQLYSKFENNEFNNTDQKIKPYDHRKAIISENLSEENTQIVNYFENDSMREMTSGIQNLFLNDDRFTTANNNNLFTFLRSLKRNTSSK
jgi:hypothetical protein